MFQTLYDRIEGLRATQSFEDVAEASPRQYFGYNDADELDNVLDH